MNARLLSLKPRDQDSANRRDEELAGSAGATAAGGEGGVRSVPAAAGQPDTDAPKRRTRPATGFESITVPNLKWKLEEAIKEQRYAQRTATLIRMELKRRRQR